MPITALEANVVSRAIALAALVQTRVVPELARLDEDYNGAVNAKGTITQAGLDAVASFSGLTKAHLDDLLYALTATLRTATTAAFAALEQGAARA